MAPYRSVTVKKVKTTSRKREAGDQAWLKTRRALLRHVKAEVRKRLGQPSADITDFTHRYEKDVRRRWRVSSQEELAAALETVDLVYGGDFHALAQAQRSHLRLLRRLNRPVVIALECFEISSQRYLDQYLAGEITIHQLREGARWSKTWGFSWDHYEPILELAKARGHRLLALNSRAKTLAGREQKAARTIARCWKKGAPFIYVIFGDLHVGSAHLPKRVRDLLKNNEPRTLTIHLNSERVYFQLAKRGLELSVDTVKFSETSYCVLSTPPWVKWQSYLLFLDQNVGSHSEKRLDDETDFDATDQVALLVRLAASDLGLKTQFEQINDLAVYGVDDEQIWREVERRTKGKERDVAKALLKSEIRFFLPDGGIAFLPRPTINSAASLAGLYLHARISKRNQPLWRFPDQMRALVWCEAVSYVISKMINHSRRSDTFRSLQQKIQSGSRNEEALRLALDFRLSERVRMETGRKRALQIKPRQKSSFVEASRILGGMLGERLFEAHRSRKLKRESLVEMLRINPGSREFSALYDKIVKMSVRM